MQMRNSPLAKTPPKNLPVIPGVTAKDTEVVHRENGTIVEEPEKPGRKPVPHILSCGGRVATILYFVYLVGKSWCFFIYLFIIIP